jgi:polysaccharide export outer membrane protein
VAPDSGPPVSITHLPLLVLAATVLGSGCASPGNYVWAYELPTNLVQPEQEYIIHPGDQLNIRVYGQDSISGTVRVREDGRFSLPMVGDQMAAGHRPKDLAELLRASLKTFIRSPVVVVALEEQHAAQVSVVGRVNSPGVFEIERGHGVLRAIAQAGGLTRSAEENRVFVVRPGSEQGSALRIRFRFRDLLELEPHSASFELQDGDVVIVQ